MQVASSHKPVVRGYSRRQRRSSLVRAEGQLWAVEQARSNEPGGTLGHWILMHLAGSEYQGWLGYE